VRQLIRLDGVFESSSERSLPDDAIEGSGSVFSSRNDVIFHKLIERGNKGTIIFDTFARKIGENMSKLSLLYQSWVPRLKQYKYWVVVICFILITFVTSDNNLYKRYTYDEKIRELERSIKYYEQEIITNRQKAEDLRENKIWLERFAREEYLMKRDNEDLYLIINR
jgi:cell division protein FtsB